MFLFARSYLGQKKTKVLRFINMYYTHTKNNLYKTKKSLYDIINTY